MSRSHLHENTPTFMPPNAAMPRSTKILSLQLSGAGVELALEIGDDLPWGARLVFERRVHASAPASIRTSSETTDARRKEGCELSMNVDIPLPLALPAALPR